MRRGSARRWSVTSIAPRVDAARFDRSTFVGFARPLVTRVALIDLPRTIKS